MNEVPGAADWEGAPSQLTSASSFVPEEYLQFLSAEELQIVIDVVQQVLDGTLPKSAIADVRSGPLPCCATAAIA